MKRASGKRAHWKRSRVFAVVAFIASAVLALFVTIPDSAVLLTVCVDWLTGFTLHTDGQLLLATGAVAAVRKRQGDDKKKGKGGGDSTGEMGGPPPPGGNSADTLAGVPQGAKRRLRNVRVEFISLVPAGANRRQVIARSAEREGLAVVEKQVRIAKTDAAKRMVYGVVYAPDETDTEGDFATADEIERAAYRFMKRGHTTRIDADHDLEDSRGYVAESWIVRSGDPLFPDESAGTWAVGIKVEDDDTWGRVEKQELQGLSLYGLAQVDKLDEDGEADFDDPAVKEAASVMKSLAAFLRDPVQSLRKTAETRGHGDAETRGDIEAEAEPVAKGSLGDAIQSAREDAGLTRAALSEAMEGDGKRDASTIGQIERGEITAVPDEALREFASALPGVSFAGLKALRADDLGEDESMEKAVAGRRFEDLTEVAKGFKERMLQQNLWTVTSALGDAIRSVLEDDEVPDKVAGVREVVDEFTDWLAEVVGATVEKSASQTQGNGDTETRGMADVLSKLDALMGTVDGLTGRLDGIEAKSTEAEQAAREAELLAKAVALATPGRQSAEGTVEELVERAGSNGRLRKQHKGLTIGMG